MARYGLFVPLSPTNHQPIHLFIQANLSRMASKYLFGSRTASQVLSISELGLQFFFRVITEKLQTCMSYHLYVIKLFKLQFFALCCFEYSNNEHSQPFELYLSKYSNTPANSEHFKPY